MSAAKKVNDGSLKVHISSYQLRGVLDDALRAAVHEQVGKTLDALVKEEISRLVQEKVKETTLDSIETEVERLLAEGWPLTDNYGQPKGERQTLSAIVLKHLTHPDNNYDRDTRLGRAITKASEQAIAKDIQPLITKASAELATAIDGKTVAALLKTIRERLGS